MILLPSQFNTLVQGESIASITPQQILAAGEPIFLDIKTTSDINSINTLIQSYARIHAPTYGQPIPYSDSVVSLTGDGTFLQPSKSEIRKIYAISVENQSIGDAITADLYMAGTVLIGSVTLFPGDPPQLFALPDGFYSSVNLPLEIVVSEGTPADAYTQCASALVIQ